MQIEEKLKVISKRYDELQARLSSGEVDGQEFVKLSKELSSLEDLVHISQEWDKVNKDMEETQLLLQDPEMKAMAQEEYYRLKDRIPELEQEIKILLLPKDEADSKNVILEIRAGTGGDEAALFAADLLRMYERYSAIKGWRFEVLELSDIGIGGYKEAIAMITGNNVFASLKFESGVHRVQRVPDTESSGRIHTSAATVAVLPEAEEVDVHLDERDIKMDVFRSSGAGGQHVNRTESAVRLTHGPSGIVVESQEDRSQHKNRETAMRRLRSKLYEMERSRLANERSSNRKDQVGSGDRSERIRTYNFPQGRVTDHRINLTLYKIDDMMNGIALEEFITGLNTADQLQKLSELE